MDGEEPPSITFCLPQSSTGEVKLSSFAGDVIGRSVVCVFACWNTHIMLQCVQEQTKTCLDCIQDAFEMWYMYKRYDYSFNSLCSESHSLFATPLSCPEHVSVGHIQTIPCIPELYHTVVLYLLIKLSNLCTEIKCSLRS